MFSYDNYESKLIKKDTVVGNYHNLINDIREEELNLGAMEDFRDNIINNPQTYFINDGEFSGKLEKLIDDRIKCYVKYVDNLNQKRDLLEKDSAVIDLLKKEHKYNSQALIYGYFIKK